MEVKAKLKQIRISPRKVRLVAGVIRGMKAETALDQLRFMNKKAAKPVEKLLQSAIANADNNFEIEKSNLFIKEIRVDEGTTLKRWMPKAQGRATPIRKRTSHINLVLAEIKESGKKGPKKQKIEAPIKLGKKPKEDEGVKIDDKEKIKEEAETGRKVENKGEKIVDPRGEGRGKHTEIEGRGAKKGFVAKMFRRKSG